MTIKNVAGEPIQLLSTFKAIYENGSINAAANVRGITQSAVSKHLQKLRVWFDDDLFSRTNDGMEPTAKAISLIDRIEHILYEMNVLLEEETFNPQSLSGTLTIATTSEISHKLTPALVKLLCKQSPDLRITIVHLSPDYFLRELESGKVDFVISVNWHAPDQLMQKRLFSDEFVCVMSQSNPLSQQDEIALEDYLAAPHIMVAPLGMDKGFIDNILLKRGLKRKIRLSVPDFQQLDGRLLGQEHIVSLPTQVAKSFAKQSRQKVVLKPLPMKVPCVDYYLFWHRRFHNGRLNQWMRAAIQSILTDRD